MKKRFTFIFFLALFSSSLFSQKEFIYNTTGFGFDRNTANGIAPDPWNTMQYLSSLTYNGQDASITAVRLHIEWHQYEPNLGEYYGAKLLTAVNTILALKPNMKFALHFNYMRWAPQYDPYVTSNDLAKTIDGQDVIVSGLFAQPSIYSESMKTKFMNFVNHALSQLSSVYNKMLYVELGLGQSEEFYMPNLNENGVVRHGFYDAHAVNAWRTEYLPCRYPGQTTVTWDNNPQIIAQAPVGTWQWGEWNNELAREYHRFGSWGLMKILRQFRDVVKSKSSSIKVIHMIPDFGGAQGNVQSLQNASIPMAFAETDGVYHTDGDGPDNWRKIIGLDVLKGTNPNKIAAVEFDPRDCGQSPAGGYGSGVNPAHTQEWMERSYKHGADYIHLAMAFTTAEFEQLKPVFAYIRANYVNGTYQAPARQPSVDVNIFPTVFSTTELFSPTYNAIGGTNWSITDNNPKSIRMIDDGYWQNVWSCTPTNPCAFSVTTSTSNSNPAAGASVTLSSSCAGQCSGVSYSWSGNGISGNSSSVTFNSPSTAGTYTYTVTASKSGCSNQTSTISITVPQQGGGTGNTCINLGDQCSGNSSEVKSYTINVASAGSYVVKLTYMAYEVNPASSGNIRINGGSWQSVSLPLTPVHTYQQTTLGTFSLNAGNNTIDLVNSAGYQCYRELCAEGSGGGCSTPAAPSLSAGPSSINSGGSSTLTATGCSGGTITWSNGLGTGSSKSVSPGSTTTYTATCSINGCTSSAASVTVTVNTGGGSGTSCVNLNDNCSGNSQEITNATLNVASAGTYSLKLTYRAHEVSPASTANIKINNGAWQSVSLPQAAPNVYVETTIGNFSLNSGNNSISLVMANGHQCYRQLCAQGGSSIILSGINPDMVVQKPLRVYPNPGNGSFTTNFFLQKGKQGTIMVADVQGRIIYQKVITGAGEHREKINLGNIAPGLYFLKIIKPGDIEKTKLQIR